MGLSLKCELITFRLCSRIKQRNDHLVEFINAYCTLFAPFQNWRKARSSCQIHHFIPCLLRSRIRQRNRHLFQITISYRVCSVPELEKGTLILSTTPCHTLFAPLQNLREVRPSCQIHHFILCLLRRKARPSCQIHHFIPCWLRFCILVTT
jgi:hypothetical protein